MHGQGSVLNSGLGTSVTPMRNSHSEYVQIVKTTQYCRKYKLILSEIGAMLVCISQNKTSNSYIFCLLGLIYFYISANIFTYTRDTEGLNMKWLQSGSRPCTYACCQKTLSSSFLQFQTICLRHTLLTGSAWTRAIEAF